MHKFLVVIFLMLFSNCNGRLLQKVPREGDAWLGATAAISKCSLCMILTDGATSGSDNCTSVYANARQVTSMDDSVTVTISQGTLQGKKVTSDKTGGQYYSFQGIPYAQPPVGDLRFKPPQEPNSWTDVRDATKEGAICPQESGTTVVGAEDCLFLNVYTPQLPSGSNSTLLPVMVWIHGGGFTMGSGNSIMYGPDYLVNKGVILVTFNYRLGVLGFFGLNSSLVSSNNGLKDQRAALRWIQANIAVFGGDKEQVTLFGQSAGGASVELQVLSPSTKGLFHRAISESGNALDRWSFMDQSSASQRAFRLGRALGFITEDETALVKFLKGVSADKLISSQLNALSIQDFVLKFQKMPFQPTSEEGSDDVFLPDSPLNILKSGKYEQVQYITGFASAEAKLFGMSFLNNNSNLLWPLLPLFMEQFVPTELGLAVGSSQSRELAAEIKKAYFGDDTPSVKNIQELINLLSEAFIIEGVRRSSQYHLKAGSNPVYVYEFSYVGGLSISDFCEYGYPFRGASHSDEIGYLFNTEGVEPKANSTDSTTRDRMTILWTNFAKTGNPNGDVNISWDALSTTSQQYLNIDTQLSIQDLKKFRADRFALWDKMYASVDN